MIDDRRRGIRCLLALITAMGVSAMVKPALSSDRDELLRQDGSRLQGSMILDQVTLVTAIGAFTFDRSAISEIRRSEGLSQTVTLITRRGDRLTGFLEPKRLRIKAENGVTPIERASLKRIILAGASGADGVDEGDHQIILRNGDRLVGRIQPAALKVKGGALDPKTPFQIDFGEADDGSSLAVVSRGAASPSVADDRIKPVSYTHLTLPTIYSV